jgi:hypothetical protein
MNALDRLTELVYELDGRFDLWVGPSSLYLNGTKLDSARLRGMIHYIQQVESIRHFDFSNTRLDDAALPDLAGLKNARSIDIMGTDISPDGFKKLKEMLPACTIIYPS